VKNNYGIPQGPTVQLSQKIIIIILVDVLCGIFAC
jgi:hypothetical protein